MAKKWVDTGYVSFTASGTVTKHNVVKLSAADTVAQCGAGEAGIGVAMDTVATTEQVQVKLFNAPGTFCCIAAGAISASSAVYTAAAGKVNDVQTGTGAILGIAKNAATADGDYIEVLREYVVAAT